jgi:hypothetical protein
MTRDVHPTPPVALAGEVAVFDPAMCCPSGLCGPGVDPALLQVSRDLRWLAAQGITVQRFGLAQEPQAFATNPRVAGLLEAFGEAALPATLVNGAVFAYGRYPTRDELLTALAAAPSLEPEAGAARCTPGSGCC